MNPSRSGHFPTARLAAAAKLVLAGPVENSSTGWPGLLVLEIDDIDEARRLNAAGFWPPNAGNSVGIAAHPNPWDRVGHLMQGFVPAMLARELLLRCTPPFRGGWPAYLVLVVALNFPRSSS